MKKLINKAYIRRISTHGLRNIQDLEIKFDKETPKHIIITGNNGVGKTTFVEELYKSLSFLKPCDVVTPNQMFTHSIKDIPDKTIDKIPDLYEKIHSESIKYSLNRYLPCTVVRPDCVENPELAALYALDEFLVLYYPARRTQDFKIPVGPKKIPETTSSKEFIQSMVNLKTQAAYANLDGDQKKVNAIQQWFDRITDALAVLLGHDEFKLVFDSEEYNFVIMEANKQPYHFTELSDGYSAILTMVTDIMLHMTTKAAESYDKPGIVIVDELETHLHVALQKKILPFLTKLFPNIQFVITTHSPFILSSVSDTVIFDLGNKKVYGNFSQYSYSNIIEGYFNEGAYSRGIISRLSQVTEILSKNEFSDEEKKIIVDFNADIEKIMMKSSPSELIGRWFQLKLDNSNKLNGILS